MGQMADDLINGFCCSECSTYFLKEHGYPVLCGGCHTEGCGIGLATEKELGSCTNEELKEAGFEIT